MTVRKIVTLTMYALTEIPLYVQDILSSLYYIRTFDLAVGRNVEVITYADGKVYPLKIIVHKRGKVTVSAGTFTCLKIEPLLQSEGLFRQKGKLVIWITDDKYKVPVKMESKVIIGKIASKLVSYQIWSYTMKSSIRRSFPCKRTVNSLPSCSPTSWATRP